MKKLGTLLSLCALGAILTACGSSSITAPQDALLNGSGVGSGNFAGETGTTTASDTTASGIARGGSGLGSGN
ncbi:MAG TPA: hypothetical protein VF263_10455 [Longimicrobiaceae bacterium]